MLLTQHFLLPIEVARILATNRCSPFALTLSFCKIAGVKLYLSKATPARPTNVRRTKIYDHRSWADFVIDSVLTSGSTYLARYLVAFFLPWSFIYSQLTGNIMFFRRQKGIDRHKLAQWMAAKWKLRPHSGLLVYPEGTRNQEAHSKKLKTGVLDAALFMKCPVQCVITTNKEHVLDETRMRARAGVKCVVSYSRVVDAAEYQGRRQAFFDAVQGAWDEAWTDAYSAKCESDVVRLPMGTVPRGEPLIDDAAPPYDGEPPNKVLAWAMRAIIVICIAAAVRRRIKRRIKP